MPDSLLVLKNQSQGSCSTLDSSHKAAPSSAFFTRGKLYSTTQRGVLIHTVSPSPLEIDPKHQYLIMPTPPRHPKCPGHHPKAGLLYIAVSHLRLLPTAHNPTNPQTPAVSSTEGPQSREAATSPVTRMPRTPNSSWPSLCNTRSRTPRVPAGGRTWLQEARRGTAGTPGDALRPRAGPAPHPPALFPLLPGWQALQLLQQAALAALRCSSASAPPGAAARAGAEAQGEASRGPRALGGRAGACEAECPPRFVLLPRLLRQLLQLPHLRVCVRVGVSVLHPGPCRHPPCVPPPPAGRPAGWPESRGWAWPPAGAGRTEPRAPVGVGPRPEGACGHCRRKWEAAEGGEVSGRRAARWAEAANAVLVHPACWSGRVGCSPPTYTASGTRGSVPPGSGPGLEWALDGVRGEKLTLLSKYLIDGCFSLEIVSAGGSLGDRLCPVSSSEKYPRGSCISGCRIYEPQMGEGAAWRLMIRPRPDLIEVLKISLWLLRGGQITADKGWTHEVYEEATRRVK
ncbi:uncharacterized protein LOC141584641 [Saimiri boliviensis]|uniref:uncharacterized protein LOC141584641 n=1 Tax=Saimiri boliviensis TaxID=27679 RepID=UPI003D78AB44